MTTRGSDFEKVSEGFGESTEFNLSISEREEREFEDGEHKPGTLDSA